MSLAIIEEEECLKSMRLKKPIPVVEKGNEIIKVANFNNHEMVDLFIDEIKGYGFEVNTETFLNRRLV